MWTCSFTALIAKVWPWACCSIVESDGGSEPGGDGNQGETYCSGQQTCVIEVLEQQQPGQSNRIMSDHIAKNGGAIQTITIAAVDSSRDCSPDATLCWQCQRKQPQIAICSNSPFRSSKPPICYFLWLERKFTPPSVAKGQFSIDSNTLPVAAETIRGHWSEPWSYKVSV